MAYAKVLCSDCFLINSWVSHCQNSGAVCWPSPPDISRLWILVSCMNRLTKSNSRSLDQFKATRCIIYKARGALWQQCVHPLLHRSGATEVIHILLGGEQKPRSVTPNLNAGSNYTPASCSCMKPLANTVFILGLHVLDKAMGLFKEVWTLTLTVYSTNVQI